MISLNDGRQALAKKRDQGFTIVELLIVIVVIGILAALVITTYSGIQGKARDAKRQSDLQAVQTQIEAFYSNNGYYPSYANLSSSSWDTTNLKSLDQGALHDPSNSATGITLSNTTTSGHNYEYVAKDSSGSASNCETTDTTCASYTLTAQLESGTVYTKTNLD